MALDLESFVSIRKFVNAFNQKNIQLDVLVNNAGMFPWNYEEKSIGGK